LSQVPDTDHRDRRCQLELIRENLAGRPDLVKSIAERGQRVAKRCLLGWKEV